jgi:hypothetical protein
VKESLEGGLNAWNPLFSFEKQNLFYKFDMQNQIILYYRKCYILAKIFECNLLKKNHLISLKYRYNFLLGDVSLAASYSIKNFGFKEN